MQKSLHDLIPSRLLPERDQMKQVRDLAAPAFRYANRNPALLIGAGVLALLGIVAFTNRKRIAAKAGPVLDDAKIKGQALLEDAKFKGAELIGEAKTKGSELIGEARARGEAIVEKVTKGGKKDEPDGYLSPSDIH